MYQVMAPPGDLQYPDPFAIQQEMYQRGYMQQPMNMYSQYQFRVPNYQSETEQVQGYRCKFDYYLCLDNKTNYQDRNQYRKRRQDKQWNQKGYIPAHQANFGTQMQMPTMGYPQQYMPQMGDPQMMNTRSRPINQQIYPQIYPQEVMYPGQYIPQQMMPIRPLLAEPIKPNSPTAESVPKTITINGPPKTISIDVSTAERDKT